MKTTIATLLVAAAGSSFAAAPTATLNHDPATYRTVTQKAAADYKTAIAQCASLSGTAKDVCTDEAKATRAHAEADAVAQYNNTTKARIKSRIAVADADYALAKARCADMSSADKENCLNTARSTHTAALADARADRLAATDNTAAGAVERAADKTRDVAATAVDKTRDAAATVADKTERAADKTSAAVSDSVITTKVKADIFKEPELKSMAIHVETDKGVVMLSGFVDSPADAEKAVRVARSVEGVTSVKSAIKVK